MEVKYNMLQSDLQSKVKSNHFSQIYDAGMNPTKAITGRPRSYLNLRPSVKYQ